LTPKDLNAHCHYIARKFAFSDRVALTLGEVAIEIPIVKRTYKRKVDSIGLLIRSGSVGRVGLDRIVDSLKLKSHDLKLRKSAKLRLISQCTPYWQVDDASLPLHFVSVLKLICQETGLEWPPKLSLNYPVYEVDETLPGTLKLDPLWKAGHSVGRAIGRIIKGIYHIF
jgi:hypothetical protein